jgi:hypothetical protein
VKGITSSVLLNAAAAAAGLLASALVIWQFGLAVFGNFTVSLAKLSIVLLGTELLPGSFSLFRLQDDPKYAQAAPSFYLLFAVAAAGITALLISADLVAVPSWFMLGYVICSVFQRYVDGQVLARGLVSLFVSVPLMNNVLRAALLFFLSQAHVLETADVLWLSLALGMVAGQIYIFLRRPDLARTLANSVSVASLAYLWSLRRNYVPYYGNSVLKRAKDTLFTLFCDFALPSRVELGKLLVYTRAFEALANQIRVLEVFLVNRAVRADLLGVRRRLLLGAAVLGHVGMIVLTQVLLWKEPFDPWSIVYAAGLGLVMYPYVIEIARRSDAYANFDPHTVTYSFLAYVGSLALCLFLISQLDAARMPMLIASLVIAQSVSAAVYMVSARRRRHARTVSQLEG